MKLLKEFVFALAIVWAVAHAMGAYGLVVEQKTILAVIQGGK